MSRGHTLALLAVLLAAAVLRAIGLGWGLRHPVHPDESAFVENVHRMIVRGDLDHRYYEYPGLMFYILLPVLRPVMGEDPPTPRAYLVARGVIAACGVLAAAFTFLLGRALLGPGAGLLAAALSAVSLVAVQTAHSLRPDVALSAFTALALLALTRVGARARDDALAGAAAGAACAVKFSGVFLLPSLLVARLLAPGPRLSGLLVAGLAAMGAFLLGSPYSLLHLGEFAEGVETQVSYHYEDTAIPDRPVSWAHMVGVYADIWVKALGWPATLLSLVGLLAVVPRAPRRWAPVVLLPLTALAVLATSHVRRDRFLLPALPAAFVLAGAGASFVAARAGGGPRARGALWGALCAAAVAPPLFDSIDYLDDVARPLTSDRAVDWARERLPPGTRVITRLDLGFDPGRAEVLRVPELRHRAQVLEADVAIATHRDDPTPVAGLPLLARFEPSGRYNGPTIAVYAVPGEARPRWRRVPLPPAAVTVSSGAAVKDALVDGRADTWWHTDEIQRAGDHVTVAFDRPYTVGRVTLLLGADAKFHGREIAVQAVLDGAARPVHAIPGRTHPEAQHVHPHGVSQVLLLDPPVRATGLRLVLTRNAGRRWGAAELVVDALP